MTNKCKQQVPADRFTYQEDNVIIGEPIDLDDLKETATLGSVARCGAASKRPETDTLLIAGSPMRRAAASLGAGGSAA